MTALLGKRYRMAYESGPATRVTRNNCHVSIPVPTASWRTKVAGFLRELFDFTGDNALPFSLREEDVRIERGTWVYYVRAVHRGQSLRQDFTPMNLTSLVVQLLVSGFVDEWREGRPWKVGVLRRRNRGLWGGVRLLHKESLPPRKSPDARVADLVAMVNAGEFDAR
jgi:hypothetical protein